jgi:hypothetical protein
VLLGFFASVMAINVIQFGEPNTLIFIFMALSFVGFVVFFNRFRHERKP